ncbi:group III truncated hemoglobin [Sanyastnella coralliicola]|uniref:group III truncated hemoglobin n=1 Tax=Sanyastnella coralliicola TaxID=3069118 RepID=UPI0027B98D2E|nr:group III truncated hemoglobin [Longitalea sp. SCSIO 12813]
MQGDIDTFEKVQLLVDSFYGKVRSDDLLGPIFENVVQGNWQPHLEKMYRFWQTILLFEHTYSGSPFPPHAKLPIDKSHFKRWLELFRATVKENFEGEKATEAVWRAEKMGEMFNYKLEYLRSNPSN